MLPSQVQNHHFTSEPLINLPVPMIIMFHVYSRSIRTRTAKSSILLCCRYYRFGGGGKVVEWNEEGAPGEGSTKLLHVMAGCLNWYGGRRVLSLFRHVS